MYSFCFYQKKQNLLSPKPSIPQYASNPSLLHSKGGVAFHEASASGRNIINGLPPYYADNPLPPEPIEKEINNNHSNNAPAGAKIAELGIGIGDNNNKGGGWLGKAWGGWGRKRAQSTEQQTLSPSSGGRERGSSRSRSRSPFGRKDKKDGSLSPSSSSIQNSNKQRNISVANMPKKTTRKNSKTFRWITYKKRIIKRIRIFNVK
eukprot:191231_1